MLSTYQPACVASREPKELTNLLQTCRSGWSGNIKGYKGEPMHIKVDQNKTKVDLSSLAICKEIAKIDADKLAQREVRLIDA